MEPQPMSLPFSGSSPLSRHRSAQAAQAASAARVTKSTQYLDLLKAAGDHGLSDWDTVKLTGWQMSSVTSIRNGCMRAGLVVPGERVGISPFNQKVTCWVRKH